jgi:glyoxylase-like metal-dependent hydrolase (beta-lactamase superfamily II)
VVKFNQIVKGLNIRPGVGFFGYSSVVLIQDGQENILFDTGGYGVRKFISDLKNKVEIHKVFISHLHFDHCANLCLFSGIPVYVHKNELSSLSINKNLYSDIYEFIGSSLKKLNIVEFSQEDFLTENTKIVLTPGHTEGHSSLEILNQDNRTLVAGDAIETYQEFLDPTYQTEYENRAKYLQSFKHIKKNYPIIIPGHSTVIDTTKTFENSFELKIF